MKEFLHHAVLGLSKNNVEVLASVLRDLENGVLTKVTAEQAACALRNYLTTGEARWEEVLRA